MTVVSRRSGDIIALRIAGRYYWEPERMKWDDGFPLESYCESDGYVKNVWMSRSYQSQAAGKSEFVPRPHLWQTVSARHVSSGTSEG